MKEKTQLITDEGLIEALKAMKLPAVQQAIEISQTLSQKPDLFPKNGEPPVTVLLDRNNSHRSTT